MSASKLLKKNQKDIIIDEVVEIIITKFFLMISGWNLERKDKQAIKNITRIDEYVESKG